MHLVCTLWEQVFLPTLQLLWLMLEVLASTNFSPNWHFQKFSLN
jgi:hypothetical protein